MESSKRRMIWVAVLVCGFAVGMAGLLNYFKYRSTAERLVHERLLVTGQAIENTIQSSLALGLQFTDIGTLPGTLERERANDDLILGIDVFDTSGALLYSTERARNNRPVPAAWMEAVKRMGNKDWFVGDGNDSAAGISIQNNFGLTIGYLALRYSDERLDQAVHAVGLELALNALMVFVVAATLASGALLKVMNGLSRDMLAVKAQLRSTEPQRTSVAVQKGPFGPALRRYFDTVRGAEVQLVELRGQLTRGHKP
jgi:hypothetical protein